MLTKTNICSA